MSLDNPWTPADYLRLAYRQARLSRDPSTQNGSCLVAADGQVIGLAYNRFAFGVHETEERLNDRTQKYPRTQHAEEGAIWDSVRHGYAHLLPEATLYVAWYACEHCAVALLESGVRRVVGHLQHPGVAQQHSKWAESVAIGLEMLHESGVTCEYYDDGGKGLGCEPVRLDHKYWTP